MTQLQSFFSDSTFNESIRRLISDLDAIKAEDINPTGVTEVLQRILILISRNSIVFDELTPFNIEHIGSGFADEIANFARIKKEEERKEAIISIFTSAYRFICEVSFTQKNDPSFEINSIFNFVNDNIDQFDGHAKQQLIYASYLMPAHITRKILNQPALNELKNFGVVVEKAKALREQWETELDEKISKLNGLKNNIKNLTSEYNFVALVDGFKNMHKSKKSDKTLAFSALIGLGLLMLIPPSVQAWFLTTINLEEAKKIESMKAVLLFLAPTLLAAELLIFYFFRVVLQHFRSLKAQLLQLELRMALCQFVESYAEYVQELRKKNEGILERFEALIFSGLVADDSGLPSTFDGADQIANVIRSLRGGKE